MIRETLWRILESPYRLWIVITVTSVIGLIIVWPAVDDYTALRARYAQLESTLAEYQETVVRLDPLEKQVAEQVAALARLEDRMLGIDDLQGFREQMIASVRSSGCQVRRIRVGSPKTRPWYDNDHPWETSSATNKGSKTPYELTSYDTSLSVSGPLRNIKDLLRRIHESGWLMHTKSISLKLAAGSRDAAEVVLELELTLFSLERAAPAAA